MKNFEFCNAARIVFGWDMEAGTRELAARYTGHSAETYRVHRRPAA